MLFVIHRANHPDLAYRGGQEPIVHLEADLRKSVWWASEHGNRWAFSLSNAGAHYTQFRSHLEQLAEINWDAVTAWDFRPEDVKEGKQAEFLMGGSFPWALVERIGVHSQAIAMRVARAMNEVEYRPRIEIRREWYF
jgi:hypothetical protein